MTDTEQTPYQFFGQYALFKTIGINAQGVRDVDIHGATIEGYDIGLNAQDVDKLSVMNSTFRGGGVKVGGERKLPSEFLQLVSLIAQERTANFNDRQVGLVLQILDEVNRELTDLRKEPNIASIRQGFKNLGVFFQHSANITQILSLLLSIYTLTRGIN